MFRKAAQKPGSPGLRHKPPVFLQAKTHAPRPFRSLPQAGRAQKRTVKSPSLRSKLAAWRRHAGSLPQAGTCAEAHSKISRVCEAKPQRGADTQDPCHKQGRAQKRTVTRCKKIKFKKNQKFSKKEKRALDTKRVWVIYSFSRRNEAAASRKGRQKASKKIKKINRST